MSTTLELPLPSLSEGCFTSIPAMTDETLFNATRVRIAFLNRLGGVSEAPYDFLNIGGYVEDDPSKVMTNRELATRAFGVFSGSCIIPRQVHGVDIYCVDEKTAWRALSHDAPDADGVAVSISKVGALLSFADCVPLILVAPSGTFAVVHAGWRGVIAGAAIEGLKAIASLDKQSFEKGFCSQCNVYIGPYIHGECFEVDEETHALFVDTFGEGCALDKTHIDLGEALRVSLERCGVKAKRIADVNACTVCNDDTYFSFRRSGGVCGRHGAFAVRYEDTE